MTDATLTPDVFGPGEMGEAKAAMANRPKPEHGPDDMSQIEAKVAARSKPDPLSGVNLCDIRFYANALGEAAIIAYWLQGRDESAFAMHVQKCRESFAKLANLMGLTVVEE